MTTQAVVTRRGKSILTPPFILAIFNDKRMALLWLPLRVWIGIQWLIAGYGKLTPAWLESGIALQGFWVAALRRCRSTPYHCLRLVCQFPIDAAEQRFLCLVCQDHRFW